MKNSVVVLFLVFVLSFTFGQKYTWIKGNKHHSGNGTFVEKLKYDILNIPSSRSGATFWRFSKDEILMFGGIRRKGKYHLLNDVWMYSISKNSWKYVIGSHDKYRERSNFGVNSLFNTSIAPSSRSSDGWNLLGNFFIFGGVTIPLNSIPYPLLNDVWELTLHYNTSSNHSTISPAFRIVMGHHNDLLNINIDPSWGLKGQYNNANTPGGRRGYCTVEISSSIGLFYGGYDRFVQYYSDIWYFNATANMFKFVAGSKSPDQKAVAAAEKKYHENNVPASRAFGKVIKITKNEYMIFGGRRYDTETKILNDVWKFNVSNGQFKYVAGLYSGDYGDKSMEFGEIFPSGKYSDREYPGSRYAFSCAKFSHNEVIIFGGLGYGIDGGLYGFLSDIWLYNTDLNQWKYIGGNTKIDIAPIYGLQSIYNSTSTIGMKYGSNMILYDIKKVLIYNGQGYTDDDHTAGYYTQNEIWKVEFDYVCTSDVNSCSNHGTCIADDVCECNEGYKGIGCDMWKCYGYDSNDTKRVCNNHGMCVSSGVCKCAHGYSNGNCTYYTCNGRGNNDTRQCNGRGVCVAYNKCTCNVFYKKYQYLGDDCENKPVTAEEVYNIIIITSCIVVPIVIVIIIVICIGCLYIWIVHGKMICIALKIEEEEFELLSAPSEHSMAGNVIKWKRSELETKIITNKLIVNKEDGTKIYNAQWSGKDVVLKTVYIGDVVNKGVMEMLRSCYSVGNNVFSRNGTTEMSELDIGVLKENVKWFINKSNFHDGVMRIMVVYPRKGVMNFVMEKCVFGNVENFLRNERQSIGGVVARYKLKEKLRLLMEICMGMEFLHSKGVRHGNLSHKEILIDVHKNCKIKGFGIKLFEKIKNPHFSAPEVHKSPLGVTNASDVYSYGVLAYSIITEDFTPFGSELSSSEIGKKVLSENLRPNIEVEKFQENKMLINLIQQCWNVDPQMRGTFTDIRKRLWNILRLYEDKKIAFVLGNSNYKHLTQLPSSKNDAYSIQKRLVREGFHVTLVLDQNLNVLMKKFYNFCEKREKIFEKNKYSDVITMFYYSGHGIVSAERFLCLPIDFQKIYFSKNTYLENSLSLSDIKHSFSSCRRGKNIIILDCCRTPATGVKLKSAQEHSKRLWNPKIKSNISSNANFLICYSTDPERPAFDSYIIGEQKSTKSPYTTSLEPLLGLKNKSFFEILREVKNNVRKLTRLQNPWYRSTLQENFIWNRDIKFDFDDVEDENDDHEDDEIVEEIEVKIDEKGNGSDGLKKIIGEYNEKKVEFEFVREKLCLKVGSGVEIDFRELDNMALKKHSDDRVLIIIDVSDDDDKVTKYEFSFGKNEANEFKNYSTKFLKIIEDESESDEDDGESDEGSV